VSSVVKYLPSSREFVAETPPVAAAGSETSAETLRLRIRQQQILADFGVLALKGTPFPELLDQATQFAAAGLEAEFAKVLKYLPEENRFLVCAGVGWDPDVVGSKIGVSAVSAANGIEIGGAFTKVHGKSQQGFARFK